MGRARSIAMAATLMLAGCYGQPLDMPAPHQPSVWAMDRDGLFENVEAQALEKWWLKFNDPHLDELIDYALAGNPDRRIAEYRIQEARGMLLATRSRLFPQIGVSASVGRQGLEEGSTKTVGSMYDAGFDASWEIDIFGRNRDAVDADRAQLSASEAGYHDVTLTLVAEVTRAYVDYCATLRLLKVAEKNLKIQDKTYHIVQDRFQSGDAPRLDLARSASMADSTRATLPELQRQADNILLRLSVLTGEPQETIAASLPSEQEKISIPGADIAPVLMAPVEVLRLRPDIHQAAMVLTANTALADSAVKEIFPSFTLGGFYGISKSVGYGPGQLWNIALDAAVSLLNFGRIEGHVDAAQARQMLAYELYRKAIIGAVAEVEGALTDYSRIRERRISLKKAYDNSAVAWSEAQLLFDAGMISFLDVLDAQRNLHNAENTLISAEVSQTDSLIRLHKALGVY